MNYIIDFIDTLSRAEIDTYCSASNITIIKQYAGLGNVFLCQSESEPSADPKIESCVLDDNDGIKLLGIDITLYDEFSTKTYDIDDNKNWWKVASTNQIDFSDNTAEHKVRGSNSTVYVLDSGVNSSHPEFENVTVDHIYSITDNFNDMSGHGTMIASLISGKTCGLTNATIKNVKVFEAGTNTKQSDLLGAFDAVITDFISNGKKPSVVNCSWCIPYNQYINEKIQILIDSGIYVVCAAGNTGEAITAVTPASIFDVLTIGSYNQSLQPSDFSNYTDLSITSFTSNVNNYGILDGWAPGEQIWAAGLDNSYGYAAGTSCASAIAAGAVAYNFSKFVTENGYASIPLDFNYIKTDIDKKIKKADEHGGIYYPTPFNGTALSRSGLLDLDQDSIYSSSKNLIVTYDVNPSFRLQLMKYMIVEENKQDTGMLSYPFNTSRIQSDNDLPTFASIDTSGRITITAPPVTDGNMYDEYPPLNLDFVQHDGTTDHVTLIIVVKKQGLEEEMENSEVPDDDPTLSMLLLNSVCGSWGTGCAGPCGAGSVGCEGVYLGKTATTCFCNYG